MLPRPVEKPPNAVEVTSPAMATARAFRRSKLPLSSTDQGEDVAVGILEPCRLDRARHMHVAFPGHSREVVVLEGNSLRLQRLHYFSMSVPTSQVAALALLVPAYCDS